MELRQIIFLDELQSDLQTRSREHRARNLVGHLVPQIENQQLNIFMPNIHKVITVNGTLLEDEVVVKLFIPEGMKVINHKLWKKSFDTYQKHLAVTDGRPSKNSDL